LFILCPDGMKPLLRSEGFHPGRHNGVSSEHDKYGDRRRVAKDGDPCCTSSGNRFGELGKTGNNIHIFFFLRVHGGIVQKGSIGLLSASVWTTNGVVRITVV